MKKVILFFIVPILLCCKKTDSKNDIVKIDTLQKDNKEVTIEITDSLFIGEPLISDRKFIEKNYIGRETEKVFFEYESVLKKRNKLFLNYKNKETISKLNINENFVLEIKKESVLNNQVVLYTKIKNVIKDSTTVYKYNFSSGQGNGLLYFLENNSILWKLETHSIKNKKETYLEYKYWKKYKINLISGKIDLIEDLNPVAEINNESAEEGIEDEKDDSNTVVPNKRDDVIYFENYNVKQRTVSNKAEIDFSTNENAKHFRKRIVEAYKTNEIDFAGHYVGVIFGCGADCISGFFIDVIDGKIYNAPLGEEFGCIFSEDKAIYKADSRLFITAICHTDSEKGKKYYISSLWNEQKKIFEEIKEQNFLSKK